MDEKVKKTTLDDLNKAKSNKLQRIQRAKELGKKRIDKAISENKTKEEILEAKKTSKKQFIETKKRAHQSYLDVRKKYRQSLIDNKNELKEITKNKKLSNKDLKIQLNKDLVEIKNNRNTKLKNSSQKDEIKDIKKEYQILKYNLKKQYQEKVLENNKTFENNRLEIYPEYESLKPVFIKPIIEENPVFITLLGLCPSLAVTDSVEKALGMGIMFLVIVVTTNILVSIIRKITPNGVRIPVFIIIIATTVTVMELLMKAYLPALSNSLGNFIALITVNCIVLGRAEAFASKNKIHRSLIDGLGVGIGFTLALFTVGFFREILGSGAIKMGEVLTFIPNFNLQIAPQKYAIAAFVSPVGSFLIIGLLIATFNFIRVRKEKISNFFKNIFNKDPNVDSVDTKEVN